MNKQSFSSNKHILILTTPFRPNVGGVETHLDDLIAAGTKQGFNFSILTYQPLITKAHGQIIEKGDGFVIYRLPWVRMNLFLTFAKFPFFEFLYLFPGLFSLGLFFLLFNRSKINTIHTQGLVAGAVGVFLGKIFQKPVVISTHSIYNFPKIGLYPFFVKFLFRNCEHILTLSNQSRQEVLGLGIPQDKVSVFTYWIDQNIFKPNNKQKARELLGLNNAHICLFVGRLVPGKGVEELLEASRKTPEVTFLIVGDGPLKDKIIKLEGQSNVEFVGKVDNKKLAVYYNAADILIVPSTHEEGFGRVILEALSCGLPVIAANRGGIREALSTKVGIFIDVTSSNISRNLKNIFRYPDKLAKLASSARDYSKTHFGEKNAIRILKYYEREDKGVLIITSHYPPNIGGVESHLQALVAGLAKFKWNVFISTYQPLASSKTAPLFEKRENFRCFRLPWFGFNIVHKLTNYPALEFIYLFPGLFLISFFVLIRYKSQIDVIHSQGLVPTAVGILLSKIFGKRVVSSTHNLYFFPKKGLYPLVSRFIFLQSNQILTPTNFAKRELVKLGVLGNKISVFHYWIDLAHFSPINKPKAREELKWSKFTILFVGRLIETKGIILLLEAFLEIDSSIQLVVIGDGPLRDYVINASNKSTNIKYLGRVENDRLVPFYSGADLILVPSIVDEGFGFVIMEAIACGTPVIASKKGGLSDALTPAIGKLIEPTVFNLKKWIEHFFHSRQKLNDLTSNTRKYATENFGENNIKEIIRAYEN